jgi:serine/threonine-protein phosphatase 2A regulatory subunit B
MDVDPPGGEPVEYKFYTEFQSHEAEFDYLKSLEIEEKINQIAWCRRSSSALTLLSTNDKTIKLWKIHEKRVKAVASLNVVVGRYGGRVPVSSVSMPALVAGDVQTVATPRRVFANAHAYHVNSISVNADGQTFLSADDLRVNLWNLENANLSFNVVDIKPPTLEELTEVITAADFHPHDSHTFMFSSSRGSIKVGDMREAALCDRRAKGERAARTGRPPRLNAATCRLTPCRRRRRGPPRVLPSLHPFSPPQCSRRLRTPPPSRTSARSLRP